MSQTYKEFVAQVVEEEDQRVASFGRMYLQSYEEAFKDGVLRSLHRRIVALEDALGVKENHGA